jgi:hypothetical protein
MAVAINLASENVRALKRINVGLIVASVALVALCATMVANGVVLRQRLEREEVRTAELSERHRTVEARLRQEGLQLTQEARSARAAQVQLANQMIDQRFFVWSRLFLDLERAVPWGVSLTAIQPQPSTATVTLRGSALTEAQLTGPNGVLRKLEAAEAFHNVSLADQKTEPDTTVSFTLNLQYGRG